MAGAGAQLQSAQRRAQRGGVIKNKHRRGFPLRCEWFDLVFGLVVGLLNSECSQQNGANKNEHGAHSQHIQSQGTVHGRASLADVSQS